LLTFNPGKALAYRGVGCKHSISLSVCLMKPLTTQTGPRDQISKNNPDVDRLSRSILRSATRCPRDQKSKPKTIQTLIACQELSKIQTKNNLDVDTACQHLSFDQQPGASTATTICASYFPGVYLFLTRPLHLCGRYSVKEQPGADRKQHQAAKQAGASTMCYDAVQLHRRFCTFFLEMMLWLTAW